MKQNGVVCYPGPALLFFIFRFEYLISGPKSYRDFRETGPWDLDTFSIIIRDTDSHPIRKSPKLKPLSHLPTHNSTLTSPSGMFS